MNSDTINSTRTPGIRLTATNGWHSAANVLQVNDEFLVGISGTTYRATFATLAEAEAHSIAIDAMMIYANGPQNAQHKLAMGQNSERLVVWLLAELTIEQAFAWLQA